MAATVRILAMVVAYILACLAASTVLTIGTLTPQWNDWPAPGLSSVALWAIIAVGAAIIGGLALLPTLLLVVLAEGFAWRSVLVYAGFGGVLALVLRHSLDFAGHVASSNALAHGREVLAASGIAGGLVYWLVAGRNAGAWKR